MYQLSSFYCIDALDINQQEARLTLTSKQVPRKLHPPTSREKRQLDKHDMLRI